MSCPVCDRIGKVIYEDDLSIVILPKNAAKDGEMIVAPKKHHQIISQLSDEDSGKLFALARKAASVYRSYNILGASHADRKSHFGLRIIPREEGDGLNLQWQPREIAPEQLAEIADALSKFQVSFEKKKAAPVAPEKPKEIEERKEEPNYMMEQLKRMP